ncbi:LysM peptidoglycan-binding domain-containing protein [Neolewinella persica]|uniref:LysM peptidoglycan-binding domain-containing protein n=1 Tax=Neolewinella persica TaxID=70998 RepID=UPI000381AD20|nr:LysM peptidoglycan-binding domain-containing protein [Neolewinella persica]
MKHFFLTLLALAFWGSIRAQATGDSLYYLRPVDTMEVYNDVASGHILFDHFIANGQTLFGISQFYGLSLEDVYQLNPKLRTKYAPGDKVKVPIPRRMIRPSPAQDSLAWFVPVHYRMRKGETFFGLYKRILQLPDPTSLNNLNPELDPSRLAPDQIIAIGYMKLDGIPKAMQGEIIDPYVRRNRGLRELWNLRTKDKKMHSANGKAAWLSKGDPGKWMALHRTAPINSLIEIEDPRSRKIIYARVVGRIPEQVNDPNVIVVVSPLLVRAFGVRDKHFYVRTRHF